MKIIDKNLNLEIEIDVKEHKIEVYKIGEKFPLYLIDYEKRAILLGENRYKFMNYFNSQKGNFFENGTKPLDEQELL